MANTDDSLQIYDFQNPGHKLNTSWPLLDLVGSAIATSFATTLSDKLQLPMRGVAKTIHRTAYVDCIASIARTCIVHELTLSPLPEKAWFCMDTSVISAIVESYFGGNGTLLPLEEPRRLSHTEMRVVKHIVDSLLIGINKGWAIVRPVHAEMTRQLPVDRLANVVRQPIMVIKELVLQIGDVELPYQLIYPHEMLAPVSEQLQNEPELAREQDTQFSQAIRRELMNCELDIRGVLAETHITLGKLLELKPGDFIPLRDVQTVAFKTSNMPLFDARVGSSNGRVSASLSRWHLPVTS